MMSSLDQPITCIDHFFAYLHRLLIESPTLLLSSTNSFSATNCFSPASFTLLCNYTLLIVVSAWLLKLNIKFDFASSYF